jgi:hypothetical protein
MSPRISTSPFIAPHRCFGRLTIGTTWATGLPRLVTTTGSRRSATWPLALRDVGTHEIYALDFEAP